MNSRSLSFELVEFELVQAGPATVLLRLSARASEELTGGPPVLVINGGKPQRLAVLPAPADQTGLYRAAFAAPSQAVAHASGFSLELDDRNTVELPPPLRRGSPPRPAAPQSAPPDAGATAQHAHVADLERRAESRRLALVELERRLLAEQARRGSAEAEVRRARSAATTEAAARVEVRTRLAEAEADVGRLTAEREQALEAIRVHAAAEVALTDRVAGLELLHAGSADRVSELGAELDLTRAVLAETRGELEKAHQRHTREAEIAQERHAREAEIAQVGHAREVERAKTAADDLRAQIVELEAELAGVQAAADDVAAALADRGQELDQLRDATVQRERELHAELGELEEQLAAREEALAAFERERSAHQQEVAQARSEGERSADEALTRVREQLAAGEAALAGQAGEVERLREATFALERELDAARSGEAEASADLAGDRRRLELESEELGQRAAELEALLEERESSLAAAQALLEERERSLAAAEALLEERNAAIELLRADAPAGEFPQPVAELAAQPLTQFVPQLEAALERRDAEAALLMHALEEQLALAAEHAALREQEAARHELTTAELQGRLDQAIADFEREREEAAAAFQRQRDEATADFQRQLQEAAAAARPPDADVHERQLIELRGALERAQNRARLHRQHATDLESRLAETQRELSSKPAQSRGGGGKEGEGDTLQRQLAYQEALAADLQWQLEETQRELTSLRDEILAGEGAPGRDVEALRAQLADSEELAAHLQQELEGARNGLEEAYSGLEARSAEIALLSAALRDGAGSGGAPLVVSDDQHQSEGFERLQARAELHKQHAAELETRLAEAERELNALREVSNTAEVAAETALARRAAEIELLTQTLHERQSNEG